MRRNGKSRMPWLVSRNSRKDRLARDVRTNRCLLQYARDRPSGVVVSDRFVRCALGAHLGWSGLELLLGGLDRPSSEGLVLVDKHTEDGMLYGLIPGPVLMLCLEAGYKRRLAESFLLGSLLSGSIFE